ncbi:MAG: pyruvate, phosphate dikinase [Anaerolineales bacterium]|nr:pyruvate, phosphate dikinase [Anaerolineales bacterium]
MVKSAVTSKPAHNNGHTAAKGEANGHTRGGAAKPTARRAAREKWVYLFGEGNAQMRDLLGGKGANLAEMTRIGLPVPPGFIVTTKACNAFLAAGEQFPAGLWAQVLAALRQIEKDSGKVFGDPANPLLLSCRSGAKFSMPGMMDTVLNIGLNDATAAGMIALTGDERFAYDAYRRLVQMYGAVVMGVADEPFEAVLAEHRARRGVANDAELPAGDLQSITAEFKEIIVKHAGREFPNDPLAQLKLATEAVFKSWNGKRAIDYRNAAGIAHDLGTAVNIVTMVFGNMGAGSGTGVVTTRNVSTGEKELEGDYLTNAQGEDVVAGTRATRPIAALRAEMPKIYAQFERICRKLEKHYREVQDVEFTIERGKLWMLQTRDAKRTAQAAVRIAVDLANEKLITRAQAVQRVRPEQVDYFLHPQFDPKEKKAAVARGDLIATGLNVSPGAAHGQLAFDADTAERWAKHDKRAVIMVRPETKPDDVHGMLAAKGILTSRGGRTSHAALVARQFGKPAVVGVAAMEVDVERRRFTVNGRAFNEGAVVSLDGTSGEVYAGQINTMIPDFNDPYLLKLLSWADDIRELGVWANADYPRDAERARWHGAEGIGLCRTEHMFFETERLPLVQEMILAKTEAERAAALARLLPFQRSDFEGLFRAMDGLPVTIRLIDPPLHEFLPNHDELLREVTEIEMRLDGRQIEVEAIGRIVARRRNMVEAIEALRVATTDESVRQSLPARAQQEQDILELEARQKQALRDSDELKARLGEREKLLAAVEGMREANPMLGLRGVRLGIHLPGLVKMQVRAIVEAACACAKQGIKVHPKIMIPLTAHNNELKLENEILEAEAQRVMAEQGCKVKYQIGTMIEIPRAAITADQVAEHAEFFSFGTNDLTQTTFGISRDDAESGFLMEYLEKGILPENPFGSIDEPGVGQLMEMGVRLGRKARSDLEIGVCGEHGGDPKSIDFCHRVGLNYVSCSPFRIPIARLAAAHAALRNGKRR